MEREEPLAKVTRLALLQRDEARSSAWALQIAHLSKHGASCMHAIPSKLCLAAGLDII